MSSSIVQSLSAAGAADAEGAEEETASLVTAGAAEEAAGAADEAAGALVGVAAGLVALG